MPNAIDTIRKAPTPSELVRLLKPNPDLQKLPGDQLIPKSLAEPDVDEDFLSEELVRSLREFVQDRETFGFEQKRRYDDESYFGIKDTFFDNWPWPGACLDDKTEVLTDRGWRLFENLDLSYRVFSINPETGKSEYMPIEALHKSKPPIQQLLSLSGKSIDLCLTPNHRLLVFSELEKKMLFKHAFDFTKIRGSEFVIPLTSEWLGETAKKIHGFDAEDWLEFLGWYIAEGWTYAGGTVGIPQSSLVNPCKYFEIECLFARMGTSWKKLVNGMQYLVHIRNWPMEAREELKTLGLCHEKFIPRQYLDLSPHHLSVLLDTLIKGDGYERNRKNSFAKKPQRTYYTTSKRLANDVQELCQKAGLRGTISERQPRSGGMVRGRQIIATMTSYCVSINTKKMAKVKNLARELVDYDGLVYCATTQYHTLYVRRNGKACWVGNSNFHEPIIPTMVDVGYTHIHASMFRDKMKTVGVGGIGKEDRPYAPLVADVLNFQNGVESNAYEAHISNAFRTVHKGTGFVKTWVDFGDNFRIRHASIPLQLIYKPIRGGGCQRGDTWVTHQLIPMTPNDWLFRKGLRQDGKPIYRHLDLIAPGFGPGEALSAEDNMLLQSQITGLDVTGSDKRDVRYMVESHLTHYPKGKFKAIEMVVWWSPKHGMIHRKVENKDLIRPLSDYGIWLNHGFAYHRSAPEILKDIQEKANYTDKQVTDAADKAISQPGYIDERSGFDANTHVRVPSAMYEVKRGTKITFEQTNIAPIIERGRQIDSLWDKAKIRLGFTDIFMGLESERRNTLGGDRIRLGKAENRFRTILDTFGIGWANTCKVQYELTDRNIPRKKLVMILGSADYANTNQLFPRDSKQQFGIGIKANFNFYIAGRLQSEIDAEEELHNALLNDIYKVKGEKDEGVAWKIFRAKAELVNFKDFERIWPKPPEAEMMSIDEVLQRIESNETMLQPTPIMERVMLEFYKFRIAAFKRTERYANYSQPQRRELELYLEKLDSIGTGANLARYEHQSKTDPDVAEALDEIMVQIGQSGTPQANGAESV